MFFVLILFLFTAFIVYRFHSLLQLLPRFWRGLGPDLASCPKGHTGRLFWDISRKSIILQWLLQDSFDICIIIFELRGKYWERTLKPALRMDYLNPKVAALSRSKTIFSHLLSLILLWLCGFTGHPHCRKCPLNLTLFMCQIACLSMRLDGHQVRKVTNQGFWKKVLLDQENPKCPKNSPKSRFLNLWQIANQFIRTFFYLNMKALIVL